MFDKEFYPTPKPLIRKMLKSYLSDRHHNFEVLSDLLILDPSAGKGDILDFISDNVRYSREAKLNAIELNPDLQMIIKEKGYPLIGSDFLQFNDDYYFDLIIMNPPFSNGDEHLLHAITLAKNTKIICLLNAETIKNPHTQRRQILLNKIRQYGSYEFLEQEFVNAERKTNVEVAIVTLEMKDSSTMFDLDFEDYENPVVNFDFDVEKDQVATMDMIGNMNLRYEQVRKVYISLLRADAIFDHYQALFLDGEGFSQEGEWRLGSGSMSAKYTHLSQQMKVHMWNKIISELDVRKYMSAKVSSNFSAFIKQQSKMAFTKENVAMFFQMIMNSRVSIWNEAVVDVFDMLTSYYKENRNHVEGWRTNDRYKVNRKLILPNWCQLGSGYESAESRKEWGCKFQVGYSRRDQYNDIDKVMAYLAGHTLPHYATINHALETKFEEIGKVYTGDKIENTCSSGYFNIKFYKKGTVHLEFKKKEIWELFNMTACAEKNWLPGPEKTQWEEEKKKRKAERKANGMERDYEKDEPLIFDEQLKLE